MPSNKWLLLFGLSGLIGVLIWSYGQAKHETGVLECRAEAANQASKAQAIAISTREEVEGIVRTKTDPDVDAALSDNGWLRAN